MGEGGSSLHFFLSPKKGRIKDFCLSSDSPDGLRPEVVVEALGKLVASESCLSWSPLDVQVGSVGQSVDTTVRPAGDVELDGNAGPQLLCCPLQPTKRGNSARIQEKRSPPG